MRNVTLAARNIDARNQRGETLAQRLARQSVSGANGCVLWVGPMHLGYGRIEWNGRLQLTHRLAVEVDGRDVPSSL